MKNSILVITTAFILCVSAFSQEKEFYYPQGETTKVRTNNDLEGDRSKTPSTTVHRASQQFPPSPLTGDEYKKRVASRISIDPEPVTKTVLVSEVRREFAMPQDYNVNRVPAFNTGKANSLSERTTNRLKGLTTGSPAIDSYIVESSGRYSVDPLLIYAQMGTESAYNLRAHSKKGASGLMQLMPATARRLGVSDIYDAKQNIEGGVKYMRILLDLFGQDVRLALAGYNAGEGSVIKYGYKIPPFKETQEYVRLISARYGRISGSVVPLVPEYEYEPKVVDAVAEWTVPPAPDGPETGTEMLRRYQRPSIAVKK